VDDRPAPTRPGAAPRNRRNSFAAAGFFPLEARGRTP
jgi:hypothetical protein